MKTFVCPLCGDFKFSRIESVQLKYDTVNITKPLSYYELVFIPQSIRCVSCNLEINYPLDAQHLKEYE